MTAVCECGHLRVTHLLAEHPDLPAEALRAALLAALDCMEEVTQILGRLQDACDEVAGELGRRAKENITPCECPLGFAPAATVSSLDCPVHGGKKI